MEYSSNDNHKINYSFNKQLYCCNPLTSWTTILPKLWNNCACYTPKLWTLLTETSWNISIEKCLWLSASPQPEQKGRTANITRARKLVITSACCTTRNRLLNLECKWDSDFGEGNLRAYVESCCQICLSSLDIGSKGYVHQRSQRLMICAHGTLLAIDVHLLRDCQCASVSIYKMTNKGNDGVMCFS